MEVTSKKSKLLRECCVRNCKWYRKFCADKEISFHKFPPENQDTFIQDEPGKLLKVNRRVAWINRLQLHSSEPLALTERVCSLHFRHDDFYYRSNISG